MAPSGFYKQRATEGVSSFYGVTLKEAELSLSVHTWLAFIKLNETKVLMRRHICLIKINNAVLLPKLYSCFEWNNSSLVLSHTISTQFPAESNSLFISPPCSNWKHHPHLIRKLVIFPVISLILSFHYIHRAVFTYKIAALSAKAPSCLQLIHILLTLPLSLSDELEFLNSAVLIKPKANTSTHYTPTHVTTDNELAH